MTDYQEAQMLMVQEIIACRDDPVYFFNNYIKVNGEIMTMNPNQIEWVKTFQTENLTRLGSDRRTGRTTIGVALTLWHFLFHPAHVTAMIVCHSGISLHNHRDLFLDMFNELPEWMKPMLVRNNQRSIEGSHGNKVFFDIASINTGRGFTLNLVFMDDTSLASNETRRHTRATVSLQIAKPFGKVITAN